MTTCKCGCGETTTLSGRTFKAGHNRRAQGKLLAQLSVGTPDHRLLTDYLSALAPNPNVVHVATDLGVCMCGCGKPTRRVFASGHGTRLTDALLRVAAGQQVTFDGHDHTTVLNCWRQRQQISVGAAARNRRYLDQSD